jgi:hypothetical protein
VPGEGRHILVEERVELAAQRHHVGPAVKEHVGGHGIVRERVEQVLGRDELVAVLLGALEGAL